MNILTYLLLVTLIQVVLYSYYLLFLRKETWFRFNRVFLLGTLMLSFFLPLTQWTFLPEITLPSVHEVLSFSLEPILITAPGQVASAPISWGQIAWNMYFTGVLASLGLFAYRVNGLISYIRRLEVQEKTPFYTLLHTNGQLPTSSFFHYIFWDETQDLSSEEKKQVLGHEYTHIRQGHSWDLLLLEIIQVVFWFHPLIYLIRQELVNVHEFHADHVATSYTPKSTYAQLILREVMGLRIPLTHSFFESPAVLRIRMLDRMPNMGRALGKYLPGIPLIALLVLIYRVTPEAVTLSGNRLDIGTSEVQILPFSESDAEEILGTKDYKNFRELRRQAIAVQLRLDSIEQIPTPWSQEVQKSRLLQELTLIQIQIQRLEQKLKQGKFGENDSQLFPRTQEENDDQESHAYGVYKSPDAKKGKLAEASAEPDVNAFIVVEKEPQLLNIREVKKAIGYPQVARKAGIEGNVIARVLVNKEGKYVRHVMLNGVHPVLERSVGAQLPELMFSPAIQNGEPVMFWVNIPFAFKLIQ